MSGQAAPHPFELFLHPSVGLNVAQGQSHIGFGRQRMPVGYIVAGLLHFIFLGVGGIRNGHACHQQDKG